MTELATTVSRWTDPATGTPWLLRFHWALKDGRVKLAGFGITSVPYVPYDYLNTYVQPSEDEVSVMEEHEVTETVELSAGALRRVALAAEAHASRRREARSFERLTAMAVNAGHEDLQSDFEEARRAWAVGDDGPQRQGPGRPPVWDATDQRLAADAYLEAQAEGLPTTAAVADALQAKHPDRRVTPRVVERVIRKAKDNGFIPE